jgi:hypothetical protein
MNFNGEKKDEKENFGNNRFDVPLEPLFADDELLMNDFLSDFIVASEQPSPTNNFNFHNNNCPLAPSHPLTAQTALTNEPPASLHASLMDPSAAIAAMPQLSSSSFLPQMDLHSSTSQPSSLFPQMDLQSSTALLNQLSADVAATLIAQMSHDSTRSSLSPVTALSSVGVSSPFLSTVNSPASSDTQSDTLLPMVHSGLLDQAAVPSTLFHSMAPNMVH